MTDDIITISAGAPPSDLTPGVYEVTLTDISEPRTIFPQTGPNAGKEVQLRDWTFALEDGSEVTGFVHAGPAERESPTSPRPDPEHEARVVDAIARANRDIPFYVKQGRAPVAPGTSMKDALAAQPPTGPVFVSWPMDDWDKPAGVPIQPRSVSTRLMADPDTLAPVAEALAAAANPVLVLGAGVARGEGWDAAVALAERLRCPVFAAPHSEAASFPEDHPLYQGMLPPAIGPLCEKLRGHDVVLVLGAPVFRYYPYVPGSYLPDGCRLFQVTDDPAEAARAPVGDSLLADPALAARALADLVPRANRAPPPPRSRQSGCAAAAEQQTDGAAPLLYRGLLAGLLVLPTANRAQLASGQSGQPPRHLLAAKSTIKAGVS